MLKILIFICLFWDLIVGSNFKKKCNSEEILRVICPPLSTNCVEDGETSGTNGTCECIHGIFNPEYTNDEDYCLISVDDSSKPKIERASHPHHIIAGVSITLILLIAGCLFVCRKKLLVRRTHSRPIYEDVMLTNDDDPPLI